MTSLRRVPADRFARQPAELMPVMDNDLTTDYLVVGAGAAAMAFTDTLLGHSDATATIVDRRHTPGGHWVDAYPYVRLHQPSSFYGVSSVPLGQDAVDVTGTNAGYYELSSADEIRAHFAQVMYRHFLPTGRVRYFPCCEYVGEHRFASRIAGASWRVNVRRKLVDTSYLEGAIPATSAPPFEVAGGVRCLAAGDITRIGDSPERFVVIGAGKTALDTCAWLLEQGVPASKISWVRPREAWWMNRGFQQPHAQLPELYRGIAMQLEAMAQCASVEDVFARLESQGFFLASTPTSRRPCSAAPLSARQKSSFFAGSGMSSEWGTCGELRLTRSSWTKAACLRASGQSTSTARQEGCRALRFAQFSSQGE